MVAYVVMLKGKIDSTIYTVYMSNQAVKTEHGPPKGQGEKRCEIQDGGQENGCDGRLMAKILIMTVQVNLSCLHY